MSATPRRAYRSPLREEQARRTRLAVITAAHRLFLADGYAATTMQAVAAAAGVATDTVYHLVKTKRGLLKEVIDGTIGGDDRDVALLDREGPQGMRAEPDQRRQIAMFAAAMTVQLQRVRPLDDVLRQAAAADREVAALRDDVQLRQRRAAMTGVVGWIAAHGPLRDGLGEAEAAAIVWTLTSPEVHHMLCETWGWSSERYRSWLQDALTSGLLPAP